MHKTEYNSIFICFFSSVAIFLGLTRKTKPTIFCLVSHLGSGNQIKYGAPHRHILIELANEWTDEKIVIEMWNEENKLVNCEHVFITQK